MHDLKFVKEKNLFVLQFLGPMSVGDGKRAFLEIVRHPEFNPDVWMFTDTRGVTEARFDFTGIFTGVQGVLSDMRKFSPQARSVILVAGETHFGLARMLEQIVDALAHLQIRVTATPEEAAAQLDMTAEALLALLSPPLSGGAPGG